MHDPIFTSMTNINLTQQTDIEHLTINYIDDSTNLVSSSSIASRDNLLVSLLFAPIGDNLSDVGGGILASLASA